MTHITFANGDKMPMLGLGTWKSEKGKVFEAVKTAIKIGYRHVDCAPIYGNEQEIGEAIKACIEEGIVRREDLWITSKLWNDSHRKEDVIPAVKNTLKDLSLDYVDLFLVHWPVALKKGVYLATSAADFVSLDEIPLEDTWQGMEEVVHKGLAKHIGVSNFGKANLSKLMGTSTIKPEMNQVETHPYFQQNDLLDFCGENGIPLTAYSPLGSSDRPSALKADNEPNLLEDKVILSIAESKNVTPAQVLISWSLHRGVSVIPKSTNDQRIRENFEARNIQLNSEEMEMISNLEKGRRYLSGEFWVFENGPYQLKDIWA